MMPTVGSAGVLRAGHVSVSGARKFRYVVFVLPRARRAMRASATSFSCNLPYFAMIVRCVESAHGGVATGIRATG